MKSRNLITILFPVGLFLLSAGYVFAKGDNDQKNPRIISELAPTIEDEVRFEQLVEILNQTSTGSELLQLKNDYEVKVLFEAGQGSSFMQAANRIRLDTNLKLIDAALIFAHEMNHAQAFHEGRKAHRKADSRQDYINKMLWEESEGMAVSIQVKMELEESIVEVGTITLPFEDVYLQAYQAAVIEAQQLTTPVGMDQLVSIGMAAGVQALFETHLRGQTRTANTHEPCIDYYGRVWDEAHPVLAFLDSIMN